MNSRHNPPVARLARRTLWHSVGVFVAFALAWLVLQAYRQPDLILELSNLRLC